MTFSSGFKVITLHVPPLRERIDDLPELVQFFIAEINYELHTKVSRVEKKAMERLKEHSWPGNVRELKNLLTRAVLQSRRNDPTQRHSGRCFC